MRRSILTPVRRAPVRRGLLSAMALLVLTGPGCGAFLDTDGLGWSREDPFDSPWRRMEHQRITAVKGVPYDVNLRWFTGAERELMVHRVDKQPMFELDFEIENARVAIEQTYAIDVCFGAPLTIDRFEFETPGVWVGHGHCPGGATPPPSATVTPSPPPAEPNPGFLTGLFQRLGL